MKPSLHPFLTVSWKSSKLYDQFLGAAAPEYKLTRNEKDVLLFLHNNAPLNTAGDIVQYRAISKSLVAKSVAALSERGFLRQTPDADDARFVHLLITPAAADAVQQLKAAQNRFFATLEASVPEDEWRGFLQTIARIGEHINQYIGVTTD